MVNFPAIFTIPITIGFKNNPSSTFIFTNMSGILV